MLPNIRAQSMQGYWNQTNSFQNILQFVISLDKSKQAACSSAKIKLAPGAEWISIFYDKLAALHVAKVTIAQLVCIAAHVGFKIL